MKKKVKETDLVCSNCGSVYPLKIRGEVVKIHGFKYAYCFNCQKYTIHQTIQRVDLYIKELEVKDEIDYTGKDKVLARHFLK